MERVPIKSDPKLFDAAVAKIQILLADAFPWLDHSFGICEKLTDTKDGKKFNSANMYIGKGSYAQIMPCSELGNFSFFILRDPQERSKRDKNLIKAPFSLIIWYDTRNVSLATDERNREAIKEQILNLLNPHAFAWLNITKTYESPDKIFSDFSYDYTNNQFLMSPYAGLRLDGEMLVRLSCGNTPIIPDRGYSKSEIDAMMLLKANVDEVGDLNDLETEDKSSIVDAINEIAEGGSVDAYTREESDNKFAPKSNTYTKTEVDGKLAEKANTSALALVAGKVGELEERTTSLESDKQDKLIAGSGITIAADGKTISSSGGSSDPEGVISQTQIWSSSTSSSYTMTNIIRGRIPQNNIDLFEECGATFNAQSGYFELNGLTDISYNEMLRIYNVTNNVLSQQYPNLFLFHDERTRTCIPWRLQSEKDALITYGGWRNNGSFYGSGIESFVGGNPSRGLYVADATYFLANCLRLKSVKYVFYNGAWPVTAFSSRNIETLFVNRLNGNISLSTLSVLTAESVLYMINKALTANPITITLHADAYARAMADADVQAALASKTNVTLASA